jgi:subtilase family protein
MLKIRSLWAHSHSYVVRPDARVAASPARFTTSRMGAMRAEKRRIGLIVCGVWAALAAASPAGSAETLTTTQARDSAAEFLLTAPPPASVGAICVVDTGVDQTPDTAAIQARISLWDDVVSDASPSHHGTLVATMIAAPQNDWGMVGIWPAARIVSIRANTTATDQFTVASYYQAMRRCDGLATFYQIKVILLALGSTAPLTEEETAAFNDIVTTARSHGINVVVAAGNNAGGALETPAQLPGVLSVGGSASDGSRCAISAVGARLQAPGCAVDVIDTNTGAPTTFQGTTAAAAVTATAMDALRSWRSDLDPDAAEQLILSTATAGAGGARINVASAFRAAGLAAVVDAAPPFGSPPPQPPPPDDDLPDLAPPKDRLPRPRARVKRMRRARLEVRLRNRPRGAVAVVAITARRGHGRSQRFYVVAHRRMRHRVSKTRVRSRRPLRVTIKYVDTSAKRLSSRPLVVRLPRVGRRRG